MFMMSKSVQVAVLALMTTVMLTGCGKSRLRQERDALFLQNQELQERLNQARAALDGVETERSNLLARISELESQLAAERARPRTVVQQPTYQAPVAANPFGGIQGVETSQTNNRITVRVPGDVLFASGKVNLRSSSLATLNSIAQVIKREYAGKRVRVEGYTDTDPIRKSKWKDNLDLSLARAATVHRHLQSQGINPKNLEAVGLGQWHPQSSKQKSRRVEIVVVLNE